MVLSSSASFAQGSAQSATAPVLKSCDGASDRQWCEINRAKMQREAPALRSRDYQAMRNAAFCQWDGCDGSVELNRRSACAWRRLIMQMHYKPGGPADRSDESNLGLCVSAGL